MAGLDHKITVAKLQELLASLNPTYILSPNMVGNLLISKDEIPLGYIDLFDDTVGLFDPDDFDPDDQE
jgi:hypothetical protein